MDIQPAVLPRPSRGKAQHAARQARYRQRQRTGRLSITLTVEPETTDLLHRLGYLELGHLEDRGRISAAILALLGNIVTEP